MTVCVKNEQDVIGAFLDYHLKQAVAHILVTDTGSTDLTPRVLRDHVPGGRVTVRQVAGGGFDQSRWVTRMARDAYTVHGADFVLHADADEFWWPLRGGDLPAAFAAVPDDVTALAVPRGNFLLSAEEVGRWWERLTVRDLRRVNWEGRPLHPKVCHRGQPDVLVEHGNMAVSGPAIDCIRPHPAVEILHFPARTRGQLERKVTAGAAALAGTPGLPAGIGSTWTAMAALHAEGRLGQRLAEQSLSAAGLAGGSRAGTTVRDERLARFLQAMTAAGELGRAEPAVIVPVYGKHHLTRAALADLRRDGCRATVYVVDNGGDYQPVGEEIVLRPPGNLHWAGGCNHGLLVAQDQGHPVYILLNNDVRLSPAFLTGLLAAWYATGADLLGPVYDRNWPQQRIGYTGPAERYRPAAGDRPVPFLDGTCLLIPHPTLRRVGLLDEHSWPRYGWGCDKDYALRVRQAGGTVWVTERAYLNHLGRQTAAAAPWYSEADAEAENDAGMATKWGPDWRELLYAGYDTPRAGLAQQRLARQRPSQHPPGAEPATKLSASYPRLAGDAGNATVRLLLTGLCLCLLVVLILSVRTQHGHPPTATRPALTAGGPTSPSPDRPTRPRHRTLLCHANLSRADLSWADLAGADLRGADLRGAILHHTDLRDADLTGADVRSTDLHGADLTGATITGIRVDARTRLPVGLATPSAIRPSSQGAGPVSCGVHPDPAATPEHARTDAPASEQAPRPAALAWTATEGAAR